MVRKRYFAHNSRAGRDFKQLVADAVKTKTRDEWEAAFDGIDSVQVVQAVEQLIDQLLDSPAWVDHWAYWYGDLFRVRGSSAFHLRDWPGSSSDRERRVIGFIVFGLVVGVIARLIAKMPADRYQSARGCAHDLRACLGNGGIAVFNSFADVTRPRAYAHFLVTLKTELPQEIRRARELGAEGESARVGPPGTQALTLPVVP